MSEFSYSRAKREHKGTAPVVTIDDEQFTLKPRLGARALEAVGRASKEDPSALFDVLRALMESDADFKRFLDLDLDAEDEMPAVVEGIIGLYGDSGKSEGSPTSSNVGGPSSTPTGSGSTVETSKTTGTGNTSLSAA